MFELNKEQFHQVKEVYAKVSHCVPVFAVLAGNEVGRVFVDNLQRPTAAFVWTEFGYFYLAGDSSNTEFALALNKLLNEELIEESRKVGETCLIMYPDSEEWEESITQIILQGKNPLKLARKLFKFDREAFLEQFGGELVIPAGFKLEKTEKPLGFALKNGDEVVCTCDTFCPTGDRVELGIGTSEQYRQKGYATLTTAAVIKECLAKGIEPNWESFWNNLPSNNLAKKLGFEELRNHPIFYWEEIQR